MKSLILKKIFLLLLFYPLNLIAQEGYLKLPEESKNCFIFIGNYSFQLNDNREIKCELTITKDEFLKIDSLSINCDYEILSLDLNYSNVMDAFEHNDNNKFTERMKNVFKILTSGKKFIIGGLIIRKKGSDELYWINPIIVKYK